VASARPHQRHLLQTNIPLLQRGKFLKAPLHSASGFTILEIASVVAILGILAALFFAVSDRLPMRAEAAKCMANMRSIQISLAAYLQDKGQWPQEPADQLGSNEDAYEDWWISELKPYGIAESTWMCPTIKRLVTNKSPKGRPKVHYTPTMFDKHPATPYRWSTQPWLIEIGNMHGQGALICYPDGSIKAMDEVVGPN
jgi:prepilin-type N-terminal cleavage/methylation domain-containing protein